MSLAGRVRQLDSRRSLGDGRCVLYWMQQAQRAAGNHALEYAAAQANELGLPLVAYFGITPAFPSASVRHYRFMLEGLRDAARALGRRAVPFVVLRSDPAEGALRLARSARLLVVDAGYLSIQRAWRDTVARGAECPVVQVETDVVVPVESASTKEQFSAATLRPRIRRALPDHLIPVEETEVRNPARDAGPFAVEGALDLAAFTDADIDALIASLGVDDTVQPVDWIRGGRTEALRRLRSFVEEHLNSFHELRNDPSVDRLSNMSPYLHFGQISPLEIALTVLGSGDGGGAARFTDDGSPSAGPGAAAYLEELIVRRELAMNYAHFNSRYDSYRGLPDWARRALDAHRGDERPVVYPASALESARTDDPYWNAAQRELADRGKMHGYMRMYWGKKIIEWSKTPESAFRTMSRLNDRYSLDGRDANGYAGIAWCFGKHDRPWKERPIFGTIRYMNARGLERKFDIGGYVARVERGTAAGWTGV